MHFVAADLNRAFRVAAMQGKGLGRLINGFFDQRWWEKNPPLAIVGSADSQQICMQPGRHLADTQFFEQVERSVINAL